MPDPTFAECFCAKHQLPRDQYAHEVFIRALHPGARRLRWFLRLLSRSYFAADYDLIYGVERLRRLRDFQEEAQRFHEHPANRGTLRRRFGMRVSTGRLRSLIRETLPRDGREPVREEAADAERW